jgi:hypothetical protein
MRKVNVMCGGIMPREGEPPRVLFGQRIAIAATEGRERRDDRHLPSRTQVSS